jgi:hypothetical protein
MQSTAPPGHGDRTIRPACRRAGRPGDCRPISLPGRDQLPCRGRVAAPGPQGTGQGSEKVHAGRNSSLS